MVYLTIVEYEIYNFKFVVKLTVTTNQGHQKHHYALKLVVAILSNIQRLLLS